MAKKKLLVTRAGTYGKVGDVITLEVGAKGLTDRQKVMLQEYVEPEAKEFVSKKLEVATPKK